jgi:hypothetical protein
MELTKVNHVITAVKSMLKGLVEAEVIGIEEAKSLLPVIVLHAIRNQSITVEGV